MLFKTTFRNSVIGLAFISLNANAGPFDFVKTKTESSDTFLIYDLPGFSGSVVDLKARVRESLTYYGDNAFVRDNLQAGEVPKYPNKLQLKSLGSNLPVSINIPTCDGATFVISSQDNGSAQYGDSARYMTCAFAYQGGYRINFYASYTSSSGGVAGLFNGKTIGSLITDAVGMDSNPQKFINNSIAKMEELFKSNGWTFNIIEMTPQIAGKAIVDDPLKTRQVAETKRVADREKRMAARLELSKLGIDATDRGRLIKAVQANDEDVISLFLEAGAVDVSTKDSGGRVIADYASSAKTKSLLTF